MRMEINRLRRDIETTLIGHGIPADEARIGTEMCLDAELRGHRSHGVRLLRNVLAEYAAGAPRRRPIQISRETPVSAAVDGSFHLSWYVHRQGVDLVIERAQQMGIGLVSVRNAGVSGALGYLVERIAGAGLVGLAANSSPLTVVAPGSSVPSLGTNPLAIGVPRMTDPPLVLDMATSAIAFNEVMRRRAHDVPLPESAAVDADGHPTTDPAASIDPTTGRGRILPFGGHRGYGLALMIELLVAAGATGRTAAAKRSEKLGEPADFSGLYLAYQPGLVGDPQAAAQATDLLLEELLVSGARLPGAHSEQRRAQALREGHVEIDDDAATLLTELRRQAPGGRAPRREGQSADPRVGSEST